MKFTDGFWSLRPGVSVKYAQEAYEFAQHDDSLVVYAPTRVITKRGDTLNLTSLTVSFSSPAEGVLKIHAYNHKGGHPQPGFDLEGSPVAPVVEIGDDSATFSTGALTATVTKGAPWNVEITSGGRLLTKMTPKSIGYVTLDESAAVAVEPVGATGVSSTGRPPASHYMHAQLGLSVGELIYGLGERFGPLIKNGQSVDVWNADGGTASEQSYKAVPFHLSSRGYGVLVNYPGHVSYEVGSETVEQVQMSVPGEEIEILIFDGPTQKGALARYTALTGRPASVPAWSYGLWLSTSFTTSYDEDTVNSFIDGMSERDIPLSVFHFDCFWMHEFNWTDFVWDESVFPDPEGMLKRLHKDKDLHLSAWINPYIAQRSVLFDEAAQAGYLVKRADGSVWQWDMWQAGMALVDFTNPEATAWFQSKIRTLLHQGIDAIKTDFGERIPADLVWHDAIDPAAMHNWYTQLYNQAVFEVLEEVRGKGEAVLFARSATAGGQKMPVHWGGDNSSSYESMAETLRGGLSLSMSGFGFWSHDIGGFEGMPDSGVFKRWVAFGLMSSHSRLHGSRSYRVPWLFDDGSESPGQSAVEVTRRFTKLKARLMPYFYAVGQNAHRTGVPFMRAMVLEFPQDPTAAFLDRQYMIGSDLLVAPVFSASGEVQFYLPAGKWTNLLTGEVVTGGGWRTEVHAFDSMPLYVREGTVLPIGVREDRADYDFIREVQLVRCGGAPRSGATVELENPAGERMSLVVASVDSEALASHITVVDHVPGTPVVNEL
ncbi:alpha-xylosidase [Populibacterium corticicola]|uniref:Alpha-xylosidase n=1 Tax=Populibacterium corticicola TaxID=1812826 RepID=A0ABW5XF09_9MICO